MSEEDETTCIESTVLEQINGSQQINRRSFVTSSNSSKKTGADNDKWRWVKLCPRIAGIVLDCGKNSSRKYLEVALLSVVVVVALLLMLLPTIFYHLPLPVGYLRLCTVSCDSQFSSTNGQFPSWYNSHHTIFCVNSWTLRLTVVYLSFNVKVRTVKTWSLNFKSVVLELNNHLSYIDSVSQGQFPPGQLPCCQVDNLYMLWDQLPWNQFVTRSTYNKGY